MRGFLCHVSDSYEAGPRCSSLSARCTVRASWLHFTIANLTPGSYELTADREGFRAYRETGIVLVNTENGMIKGAGITQAEVNGIPMTGRDFTELALFVPGVVTVGAVVHPCSCCSL